MEDFNEYDHGWRLGTFDKCNGRSEPRVEEDGSIYAAGYYDAWSSNESQMPNPLDQLPGEDEDVWLDRVADEASGRGETFASKVLRPLIDAEIKKLGYKDEAMEYFWEGVLDQL